MVRKRSTFFIALVGLFLGIGVSASADSSDPFSCALQNKTYNPDPAARLGTVFDLAQSSSRGESCQVRSDFDQGERSIAKGTLQTMAMMYGNCSVLSLPATNSAFAPYSSTVSGKVTKLNSSLRRVHSSLSSLASSHYYLQWAKDPKQAPSGCANASFAGVAKNPSCGQISCLAVKYPPLYQFGSAANGYNLYHLASSGKGHSNTQGIDCSAFISESMWVQGLRFYPEGSDQKFAKTTRFTTAVMRTMGKGDDCFRRPKAGESFKPGDVLVSPSHVVAIDTVGSDPFRIEEHLNHFTPRVEEGSSVRTLQSYAKWTCEDWITNPEEFKLTVIHSSSSGNLGIQRQKLIPGVENSAGVSKYKSGNGIWKTFLLEQARSICEDRVYEVAAKAAGQTTEPPARTEEASTGATGITMLRHESDRAECKIPKAEMPKIPGLDCAQCCSTDTSYEAVMPESRETQ